MLGEGYGSPENVFQVIKGARGKKIARKDMPMTINERR